MSEPHLHRPVVSRAGRLVFGYLIIAVLPVRRVASIHQGYGIRAALVALVGAGACLALDRRSTSRDRWWGTLVVAVPAGVLGAAAGGRIVGAILLVTTVFGAWYAFGWRVPRVPRADPRARLPVVALVVVGAWLAREATALAAALAWYFGAVAVGVVTAVRPDLFRGAARRPDRSSRVGRRTARWVGRRWRAILALVFVSALAVRFGRHGPRPGLVAGWYGATVVIIVVASARPSVVRRAYQWTVHGLRRFLTVVLLTPLWVIVALVPWAFQRIVRFDPLRPRGGRGTSWIARRNDPEMPDRMWFSDPARDRPSFARGAHARAPGVLAVLVVIGSLALAFVTSPVVHGPDSEAKDVLEATPGYRSTAAATNRAIHDIWYSQYAGYEWRDVASPHVNITDGRRASWKPATCDPQRLVVWMFGGSTLFGVLERDERTIPAEVAKAAAAQGISLEAVNWGVVADVSWVEGRRFERALAAEPKPDAVVFYDGFNDLFSVINMDFDGRGGPADFVGEMDHVEEPMLTEQHGLDPGIWRIVRVPRGERTLDAEEAVDHALTQYRTADRNQRILARAYGIDVFRFHQPNIHTRDVPVAGEPETSAIVTGQVRAFQRGLPDEVVDLGGALDGVEQPLFYDDVHTVEAANPLIARAIVDAMAPALERLAAATREDRPCP